MKISRKIILGFSLTAMLAALVCFGCVVYLQEMSKQYQRQEDINRPVLHALHEVMIAGQKIISASSEVLFIINEYNNTETDKNLLNKMYLVFKRYHSGR